MAVNLPGFEASSGLYKFLATLTASPSGQRHTYARLLEALSQSLRHTISIEVPPPYGQLSSQTGRADEIDKCRM